MVSFINRHNIFAVKAIFCFPMLDSKKIQDVTILGHTNCSVFLRSLPQPLQRRHQSVWKPQTHVFKAETAVSLLSWLLSFMVYWNGTFFGREFCLKLDRCLRELPPNSSLVCPCDCQVYFCPRNLYLFKEAPSAPWDLFLFMKTLLIAVTTI